MDKPKINITDQLNKIESVLTQDEKLVMLYQLKHCKDQDFKEFWEALERILKGVDWSY